MTKETVAKYCKEFLANEKELERLKARQEAIKQKLQEATLEETPKYKIVKREVAPTMVFDNSHPITTKNTCTILQWIMHVKTTMQCKFDLIGERCYYDYRRIYFKQFIRF